MNEILRPREGEMSVRICEPRRVYQPGTTVFVIVKWHPHRNTRTDERTWYVGAAVIDHKVNGEPAVQTQFVYVSTRREDCKSIMSSSE